MYISAQADYAMRALLTLAASESERPVKAERLASAQQLPANFLETTRGEAEKLDLTV
jgi:DNA-binding IscR family transcriptional regulator